MQGIVYQINIKPETPGERGLPKKAIDEVNLTSQGIIGDFNQYRHEEHHDDLNMALLILPLETIVELNQEDWPVKPGDLGENITTQGISYDYFEIGRVYCIGEAIISISKICKPCNNLKNLPYVGYERKAEFCKALNNRRGWYARVLSEGTVRKRDKITRTIYENA